jgi:hypothetical protein
LKSVRAFGSTSARTNCSYSASCFFNASRGITLGRGGRAELGERRFRRLALLSDALLREPGDLLIESRDAELAGGFRREPREDVDQQLRVAVALGDPGPRFLDVCGAWAVLLRTVAPPAAIRNAMAIDPLIVLGLIM